MRDKIYLGSDLKEALKRAGELVNEGHRIRMRRGVDAWDHPDGTYMIIYNEKHRIKIKEKK